MLSIAYPTALIAFHASDLTLILLSAEHITVHLHSGRVRTYEVDCRDFESEARRLAGLDPDYYSLRVDDGYAVISARHINLVSLVNERLIISTCDNRAIQSPSNLRPSSIDIWPKRMRRVKPCSKLM